MRYFDYFMIFMANDSVCGFTFIGKERFDGHPEFHSACNTFNIWSLSR